MDQAGEGIISKSQLSRTSYRAGRYQQIFKSIPHYLAEIRSCRSFLDLGAWLQFKMPYLFALPGFPPRITLELTNQCNLTCRHCHRKVMKREVGTMNYALLRKIVDEISTYPACLVKIGGLGEPGLYEHFSSFMQLLKDKGIKCILYTNGLVLERYDQNKILEWGLSHIVVSIDGIDEKSYEMQRIGGNYKRLRSAVGAFHRIRADLGVRKPIIEVRHVILQEESLSEIDSFKRTWLEIADTVMFNHMIPSGPFDKKFQGSSRRCRDIRREMYVRWNGLIPLCGYQYLVTDAEWIGDLHNMMIREAWQNQRLWEIRTQHASGTNSVPDYCLTCSQTV